MMLPLIMAIDIFWNRFALALLFPLAMMVLVPISFSSSRPAGPHDPNVSCAMGMKWLSLASSLYFLLLISSAAIAAEPASLEQPNTLLAARVSLQV